MNNESARVAFIGGAVSGTTAVVVGHPMDTVKVRMQAARQGAATSPHASSMFYVTRDILRTQGIVGFYRGLIPPLLATGFLRSVQFSVYAFVIEKVTAKGKRPPTLPEVLAGGMLAGASRAVFESPIELAKVRRQVGTQWSWNLSLYNGFSATLARNCALLGSFFVVIHSTRDLRKDLPPLVNGFVTGGVAATAAWWLVFPFDVLKSQAQAQTEGVRPTMWQRAQTLWAAQGLRGFFRGVIPQSMRSVLGNGAGMAAYEAVRHLLS